jgi:hypothetical protein
VQRVQSEFLAGFGTAPPQGSEIIPFEHPKMSKIE